MNFRLITLTIVLASAPLKAASLQGTEPRAEKPAEKDKKPALSLKSERKIEFTTDEGTWLSLDVSPDGKTILFELLGDLYTLPIEGGTATALLTGMAFDSQPVYSPDGKRIAFISDREGAENLFLADVDGKNIKQITKDEHSGFASPAWTPDGQYVLVTRTKSDLGARELYVYNLNGGAGVQITKESPKPDTPRNKRLSVLSPIASPDGKFIYYAKRAGLFSYNVTFPLWQIVRRDRTTGDEDVITNEPGSAFRPLLSHDGKKLVYGTRMETETGLKIRDLDTGIERWLKYPIQRDDQESIASRDVLPGYAFTPDDQDVILNYGGKIHRVNVSSGTDTVIPFSAKVSQDLGPRLYFPRRVDEGAVKVRLIQGPEQSPDGSRIVFSALTHLYVSPIPATKATRLTSGDAREYQPTWSPDGQWIAYVTWTAAGGHIWKTRADGTQAPQQLTRVAAFYRDPAWSPDSSKIVALRSAAEMRDEMETDFEPPTGLDVIWLPASGGNATLIAPARGAGQPHFVTREPDRVQVYSPQGLISMRFDGTDKRTVIKVVGKNRAFDPEPPAADDVRLSPDGLSALALVESQLWILAVPRTGETPQVDVSAPSVPVKKLTRVGADYLGWSRDGQTVTWGLGSSFFRQSLSTVSYEAEKKPEGDARPEAEKPMPPAKPLYEEFAVNIELPRHKPTGNVVLRGAQVITMKGDEILENADIVVTDNRITGIGKRGSVTIPAGAKVIDVKGTTIMPGIVDVHAHWFEVRRKVMDMENWDFLANLAYGVTSGRDPQTATNDMFAYQDLVDTGDILGPRAYSTGPGVFGDSDFQTADDAKDIVSKYQAYYRTHTLKSYVVGNRKQRQWMVEACQNLQIMPTTEGALDLKLDLTHVIDGFTGNEHALPIVPLYKDVVEMFAKSGIFYTPTLLVAYGGPFAENYFLETTEVHNDPKIRNFFPHSVLDEKTQRRPWFTKDQQVFPKLAASAAKIVHDGGRVCLGGHGEMQGIQVHWEMWALQSGGLTNLETLRAATLHGAESIGLSQDIGSLETGKLADLIVLKADPLRDIRNTNTIQYVMKNGELFEGDTLNEIWPEAKPLPQQWWQKQRMEFEKLTRPQAGVAN